MAVMASCRVCKCRPAAVDFGQTLPASRPSERLGEGTAGPVAFMGAGPPRIGTSRARGKLLANPSDR